MHDHYVVFADLVRTLVKHNPLPWQSLALDGEHRVIASNKTIILETRDPAIVSLVIAFANASHRAAMRA